MRFVPVVVLGTATVLFAAPVSWAGAPAKAMGRQATVNGPPAEPGRRVSVLVELEPGVARGPVRAFARDRGGHVKYEYSILPNLMNLRQIPEPALAALERVSGVRRILEDGIVRPHLNQSTPLLGALKSQVEAAGYAADGSGVRICVVDTGIDSNHVMYADRIDATAGKDFVNDDDDPEDDYGHGAHVAGIALGGDGNTIDFSCGVEPFQGVAWEATLIGVKVIAADGFGSDSDVIAGIDHCADGGPTGGRADVINLSIGGGNFPGLCDGDPVAAAANAAAAAGLVVVASSGNSGELNALATPACGKDVIAVGAVYDDDYTYNHCEVIIPGFDFCIGEPDQCGACSETCSDWEPVEGQICCFSNRSLNLDVVAPGCLTASADHSNPNGEGAIQHCGTSMAAPHVAGLAALLLSANPSLTPAEVRSAITGGAVDQGDPGPDTTYGNGLVHALDSLALVTCSSDADCSDGDTCTTDTCSSGVCTHTPPACGVSDGCCVSGCGDPDCPPEPDCSTNPDCDDGNACTVDVCSGGTCSNDPADCDDGSACTIDSCDAATGCANDPVDCSDGSACTTDTCDPVSGCANDPVSCDDGNVCTTDGCDVVTGCANDPIDCGDGNACTNDTCDPVSGCASDPVDCDDGNACTTDTCDAVTGCAHDPVPGCGTCQDKNQPCSSGTECCSGVCKPNGRCR